MLVSERAQLEASKEDKTQQISKLHAQLNEVRVCAMYDMYIDTLYVYIYT